MEPPFTTYYPLDAQLRRLIEQGKQTGPAEPQAKAIECQVIFKSGYAAIGALSVTENGIYRLLSPGEGGGSHGSRPDKLLLEHFFEWSAVETVVLAHKIEPSRIAIPGRS